MNRYRALMTFKDNAYFARSLPVVSTLIAALILPFTARAQEQITPFVVHYTLQNKYVTGGKASFAVTNENNQYQIALETKPTGVFKFSKKGRIKEVSHLHSLTAPFLSDKYIYTRGGDKKRSYSAEYNRESRQASVNRRGETNTFPLSEGAVDRLATTLTMMQQLHSNPAIDKFTIDMIDHKGVYTAEFSNAGQTTLSTRLGKLNTIKIERTHRNSNRRTITWFAKLDDSSFPIPVQIEQHKDGELSIRLSIDRFSLL